MAKQFYKDFSFRGKSKKLIEVINGIIDEYIEQGFRLTVRQLYYQLVARGHIENTELSYKRTTGLVNDARLAGLIDWDVIEDRTRAFIKRPRWDSGANILEDCAAQFHMDMWEGQDHRVFVIVEKEALAGVLEGVCNDLDTPLLAARGYPSGTVLREFAISDVQTCMEAGQTPILLHLGDHDPSGIDMTRDLEERILLFSEVGDIQLTRIALNMDQIKSQKPPPNPAKVTDSRFAKYRKKFGDKSWELDALSPDFLAGLVRFHTEKYIDKKLWSAQKNRIFDTRAQLTTLAREFDQ